MDDLCVHSAKGHGILQLFTTWKVTFYLADNVMDKLICIPSYTMICTMDYEYPVTQTGIIFYLMYRLISYLI